MEPTQKTLGGRELFATVREVEDQILERHERPDAVENDEGPGEGRNRIDNQENAAHEIEKVVPEIVNIYFAALHEAKGNENHGHARDADEGKEVHIYEDTKFLSL